MWKILICSEDKDFMRDLGHRIRRLAGERLKEVRLFSNKEDLDFYTTGRPEESNIILIDISRDNEGTEDSGGTAPFSDYFHGVDG